jgi:hypothetical protein
VRCSEACAIAATLVQPKGRSAAKPAMLLAGSPPAVPAGVSRGRAAQRRARVTVIGRGTARLAAAGTAKVVVKLTAKARRTLKRARRLSATLKVVATDPAGNATTKTSRVSARR